MAKINVGDVFTSNSGVEVEVISVGSRSIGVRRIKDGYEFKCTPQNLIAGRVTGERSGKEKKENMKLATLQEGFAWVPGFEKRYSVNQNADVMSHIRQPEGKLMKASRIYNRKRGEYMYKFVNLTVSKGKFKLHYLHRLVAMTFIPNPENKPCVNHIDSDKANNHISNLEWCTQSENTIHAYEAGRFVDSIKESVLISKQHTLTGEHPDKRKGIRKPMVTPQDLEKVGVPPELIDMSITQGNYRDTWQYYVRIFYACSKPVTLQEIADAFGIDISTVSLYRNGLRMAHISEVYDKYRNSQKYVLKYLLNWEHYRKFDK